MLLNAIVFSKDRPMQLNLLLESILLNFNVEDFKLNVLYKASNDEFNKGYHMVKDLYPQFIFKNESHFKEDLLSLFNNSQYTVFFTDDDIIYRSLKITKKDIENIFAFSSAVCFSLRLGLNTINCYMLQKLNKLHNHKTHFSNDSVNLIEPIISWQINDATNDYAYPMSVDGHIFKTSYIKYLCEILEYENPNLLESFLSYYTKSDMIISSYEYSKLVNTPINRVQKIFENISGIQYNYSAEDLNKMYLNGIRIDFKKMDFQNVNGCHQEIEPIFKN
jgi:hypothetical protein